MVFDWDGTLMDSEARIVACLQAAASDAGIGVPGREAAKDIIGLGLAEAISTLFPGHPADVLAQIAEASRRHWLGEQLAPAPLFNGYLEAWRAARALGEAVAAAGGDRG